jgi:pimeloyl-ACP methyl ester carboxylesterase
MVDHCRHDISAWIEFLGQRRMSRVLLSGHSLGAVKALYAQAHEPSAAVRCLVAISPPRLSHSEFQQGPRAEKFRESLAEAQRHMQEGRPAKLIMTRIPVPLVISAATYLDKHGPQERYNFLRFLPQIACPVLFTYGGSELARGGPGFNGVTQAIDQTRAARQNVEVRTVAGADHFYSQAQPVLAEEIIAWLERQF